MTDGPSIPPPPPSGGNSSLVNRVINILTKPASEWAAIEAEPSSTGKLITYAALLSVLPVVFSLLAILITPFGSYIFQVMSLLIKLLILTYLMALVPPVALGYILDALTPQLGGQKNSSNAMKLAIYSGTAYWVGSVGLILSPWLWLVIGVGYAGYLLWVGTPILMKTAADKTPVFVGAAVGIWVVLYIILNMIAQRVIFSGMMYGMM
jgi:hypothetical protein